MKKIFLSVLTAVLFAMITTGCMSTPNFTQTDPLNVGKSDATAVLRVVNGSVSNSARPFAKINGVTLSTDEIILPAGSKEYDVEFKFKGKTKSLVQATINMNLTAGKTYQLAVGYDATTTALSGIMVIPGINLIPILIAPYQCRLKLYEYSANLKKTTLIDTIEPKKLKKLKWKDF
ncbi:hypothetical protein FACS1894102_1170 [Spirochaetia bacterium]|nr:hypothetical protein FACS1894102_1170 [Spirochaetia bacterium]